DRHKLYASTGGATPGRDVAINDKGRTVVVYDHGVSSGNDNIYMKTISSAGVSGERALTDSTDSEVAPKIGYNTSTGEFVVLYERIEGFTKHAFVREFNRHGHLKKDGGGADEEHDLGANTSGTGTGGISLDGLDRYFAAYESIKTSTNHDMDGVF